MRDPLDNYEYEGEVERLTREERKAEQTQRWTDAPKSASIFIPCVSKEGGEHVIGSHPLDCMECGRAQDAAR